MNIWSNSQIRLNKRFIIVQRSQIETDEVFTELFQDESLVNEGRY